LYERERHHEDHRFQRRKRRLTFFGFVTVALVFIGAAIGDGGLFLEQNKLVEATPAPSVTAVQTSATGRSEEVTQLRDALGVPTEPPTPTTPAETAANAERTTTPKPAATPESEEPDATMAAPEATHTPMVPDAAESSEPAAKTPVEQMADETVQQVSRALAGHQTGMFEATLKLGNGTQSHADVVFDLEDDETGARLHITSVYENEDTSTSSERIVIGPKSWNLGPNGEWIQGKSQAGVLDQVRVFLPNLDAAQDIQIVDGPDHTRLVWFDEHQEAEVSLTFDLESDIPINLLVTRSSSEVLRVNYTSWNSDVRTITVPVQ
jgi:cytoskeletal protein RodZ